MASGRSASSFADVSGGTLGLHSYKAVDLFRMTRRHCFCGWRCLACSGSRKRFLGCVSVRDSKALFFPGYIDPSWSSNRSWGLFITWDRRFLFWPIAPKGAAGGAKLAVSTGHKLRMCEGHIVSFRGFQKNVVIIGCSAAAGSASPSATVAGRNSRTAARFKRHQERLPQYQPGSRSEGPSRRAFVVTRE